MKRAIISALSLLIACGGDAGVESTTSPEPVAESPPAAERQPAAIDDTAHAPAPDVSNDEGGRPERGCVLTEPSRLWDAPLEAAVVHGPRGFLYAAVVGVTSGERLELFAGSRRILNVPIVAATTGRREAPPGLAVHGDRVAVAVVDGSRRVQLVEHAIGSDTSEGPTLVGEPASLRFAPAVSRAGTRWAVAWTEAHDGGHRLHGRLVDSDGEGDPAEELSPPEAGGAAPTFVAGATDGALVFVDAREGLSVAHRVALGANRFRRSEVARPIGLAASPPALAAARVGEREWLAFTAVGSAATTAIGLLPLDTLESPEAIVAGTGYGRLHVAVAAAPSGAFFAATFPLGSPPSSARAIRLEHLGEPGRATLIEIRGPRDTAEGVGIASAGDRVALVFRDAVATYALEGRCASR